VVSGFRPGNYWRLTKNTETDILSYVPALLFLRLGQRDEDDNDDDDDDDVVLVVIAINYREY